jgi:hypothetical protein
MLDASAYHTNTFLLLEFFFTRTLDFLMRRLPLLLLLSSFYQIEMSFQPFFYGKYSFRLRSKFYSSDHTIRRNRKEVVGGWSNTGCCLMMMIISTLMFMFDVRSWFDVLSILLFATKPIYSRSWFEIAKSTTDWSGWMNETWDSFHRHHPSSMVHMVHSCFMLVLHASCIMDHARFFCNSSLFNVLP